MPFFLRGSSVGKNQVPKFQNAKVKHLKKKSQVRFQTKRKSFQNEEITSDEDDTVLREKYTKLSEEFETEDEETAQEKKVRLAQQYLQELKEHNISQNVDDENDDENTNNALSGVLRDEVLDASGRLNKPLSHLLTFSDDLMVLKCKQQKLPITCIAVTADAKYIYSASKDSSIVKWSITGEKIGYIHGKHKSKEDSYFSHTSPILSLAVSSDSLFLASGDTCGYVNIWNAQTLDHLKRFKKNRSAISGLVFRMGSHTLYSCSHDRNVMVWNLDAMAFVEHLGGHAAAITGIDALHREACISSGGRAETVIVYQIVQDKQLIFNGRQASIDGVKLINDKMFITYGQDGSLALWTTMKKKPVYTIKAAHGTQDNDEPRWLTAVSALVNSDVIATGSWDGLLRLWKIDIEADKKICPLFNIPVNGVVNCLSFTTSGSHLIVGVGQEHKLGRWFKVTSCYNSVIIVPLGNKTL